MKPGKKKHSSIFWLTFFSISPFLSFWYNTIIRSITLSALQTLAVFRKQDVFGLVSFFYQQKMQKEKKRKAWQPPLGSHPAKRERIIKKYFKCWRGQDVSSKANSRWYKTWLSPSISWTNLTQKVLGGFRFLWYPWFCTVHCFQMCSLLIVWLRLEFIWWLIVLRNVRRHLIAITSDCLGCAVK